MTPPRPLRLALLNDYPVVVAGLAALLRSYRARVVVLELDSQTAVRADVDIVLVDEFGHLASGPLSLVEVVDHAHATDTLVVLFGWDDDLGRADRAEAVGADGHLSKNLTPEELVAALEAIRAGRSPAPAAVARAGETELMGDWPGRSRGLSTRESEIVALIALGMMNDEIAATLYISINTVKTHIRSAYRTMGVQDRPNAILWAARHGFALRPTRKQLPDPSR